MRATRADAYRLWHAGQLTLARCERNGIAVDMDYLTSQAKKLKQDIKEAEEELQGDEIWRTWCACFKEPKLGSSDQLSHVIFKKLGYQQTGNKTEKGDDAADEAAFRHIDLPFVKRYFHLKKLNKVSGTYFDGMLREVCDGLIHPSFNLHTARSYRSCIAKGTMVEVCRDVAKYPRGIPIEDVREGDYAYCYDNNRKLTLRRVLWAGKTGTRKVIRLHWRSHKGRVGYLDLTPEHRVRVVDGSYVEARHLKAGDSCLAMGRRPSKPDGLYETRNPEVVFDHRLVYSTLVGELSDSEVVHHKDGNHLNNVPSNLEAMTQSEHARLHAKDTILTDKARYSRLEAIKARVERHKETGAEWPSGQDCPNALRLTRMDVLRALAAASGRPTFVPYDFDTFKSYCERYGIDIRSVRIRYDRDNNYISLGRLLRAEQHGREFMRKEFGVNFYKLKEIMEQRGLDTSSRRWANQYGQSSIHNHKITAVEELDRLTDVYDIEVDEVHNFMANELCVHNSGSSPNLQNVPSRVDWIMQMIRRCFVPRSGGKKRSHRRRLVEVDSTAFEVKVSYTYHQDPTMRAYLLDPNSDMHGDTAEELFLLPKGFVKQHSKWAKKSVRDWAKNRFVFAQFYGDVYYQRAPHIWEAVTEKGRDGSYTYRMPDGQPIYEYLASKGIKELGRCLPTVPAMPGTYEHLVKRVERSFWEDRFPVYTQWKKRFHEEYLRNGYFDLHTGFRCEGVFKRNQVLCIPTQGAAFHVLLAAMILTQEYIDRYDLDALLVAEIHDSIIADVAEDDVPDYLTAVRHILTRTVPSRWKWINIDLGVEAEVCPVGESWDKKSVWTDKGGVWAPAGGAA